MIEKNTISVIKSDVGPLAGHQTVPKPLLDPEKNRLKEATNKGQQNNYTRFSYNQQLICAHNNTTSFTTHIMTRKGIRFECY